MKKAISVAKELGLDCIELRGCWNKNIKDLTNAEVQKIKAMAKRSGLKVVCISSPFFKCNVTNEKEVKEHLKFLPRVIEITKLFDSKIVRGFAFWSVKNPGQYWNAVIENLREAAEKCNEEGVVLALENEYSTLVGTGKESKKAIEEVGSKNLRLVWDPGNAFCAGEVPYPDGYLNARDYMVHMHLKDAVRDKKTGEVRFVAVGSGEIDYEGQFEALKKDKYNGCASIETHYRINNDGEKSTRETYNGLKQILNNL
ncbi:sugar phosphate isomerase/epimerase [Candidatus Bathyarchaeota archaeon]|nr:sugar phosphate isomerase/epimerase [Candidatus Bathyarchaeota archaeon]